MCNGNKHYFFGIQQYKSDTVYNVYEVDLDNERINITGPEGREDMRKIQMYDKIECYNERSSGSIHVVLLDSEKKRVDYARLSQIQMNWELEPQGPIFSGDVQGEEELTNMYSCLAQNTFQLFVSYGRRILQYAFKDGQWMQTHTETGDDMALCTKHNI